MPELFALHSMDGCLDTLSVHWNYLCFSDGETRVNDHVNISPSFRAMVISKYKYL